VSLWTDGIGFDMDGVEVAGLKWKN
ncbi:unnamed protein product, partial [Allacma fusca]